MAENFELNIIPTIEQNVQSIDIYSQSWVQQWNPLIDSSTTALREIDPLFKHCFETGTEYQEGTDDYGKVLTDAYFLILNVSYHTSFLYESAMSIKENVELGFEGKDSQYYQSLGKEAGKVLFYTFYNIEDFTYPDIPIEYPSDFEDEVLLYFN